MYEFDYTKLPPEGRDTARSYNGSSSGYHSDQVNYPIYNSQNVAGFKRAFNKMMIPLALFPLINIIFSFFVQFTLEFIARVMSNLGYISADGANAAVYEVLSGSSVQSTLLNISLYLLVLFVPFLFYLSFSDIKPSEMMSYKIHYKFKTFLAILTCVGGIMLVGILSEIINNILSRFGIRIPEVPSGATPVTPFEIILNFIHVAVLAPFVEEFIFRGVIMGTLKKYSKPLAIVFSALVFAVVHGNIRQGVYAFATGIIIGYFVIKYNSLWIGIGAHFINNAVYFLQNILSSRLPQENAAILINILTFLLLAAGISALIVLIGIEASPSGKTQEKYSLIPTKCARTVVLKSPLTYVFFGLMLITMVASAVI